MSFSHLKVIIYAIVESIKFLVPDIPDEVFRKLKDERNSFITQKDGKLMYIILVTISILY